MRLGEHLTTPPPMSNAERQRRFRERNPGYHRRYYVSAKAHRKQVEAQAAVELAARRQASGIGTQLPLFGE